METLESLKKSIGKRIKSYRKKQGLTQEKLSEMVNIESRHLSGIETGNYTASLKTLNKISNILDVKFEDLIIPYRRKEIQTQKQILEVIERAKEEIIKILS